MHLSYLIHLLFEKYINIYIYIFEKNENFLKNFKYKHYIQI